MRSLLYAAGLAAALILAAPAGAQTATPIPMPPKPDLTPFKGFIGSWSCSEQSSRRPSPTLSTTTYALDATGYWIVQTTKTSATPWYPHTSTSTDYITYDLTQRHWADVYVDSTGGYDASTSPGPKGGSWTWHDLKISSPAPDVTSFSDSTTSWAGPDRYVYLYSFTTKAGKTVTVKGGCKRTV